LGKRIYVNRADLASIHLADNLADVALVAPSVAESVAEKEVLRVLHPGAKAIIGSEEFVKPLADGTDDWSYPHHGADNNPQSADQVVRAPYLTQFIAEPKFAPSPAVTVASAGRVFRVTGHLAHKANQNPMLNTLLAVNAYNGTILWKRPYLLPQPGEVSRMPGRRFRQSDLEDHGSRTTEGDRAAVRSPAAMDWFVADDLRSVQR
jgi:hypothetical protein